MTLPGAIRSAAIRHAMRRATPPPAAEPAPPSKTRRKKDMLAVQELGEALVALDPARVARLDLPERLVDAIREARSITRHEARRRQLQFVGRLMRDVDPEPIRQALAAADLVPREERARFLAAEAWRDRLLADTAALAEFVEQAPATDRNAFAALVDEARAERAAGTPPHKYRALFRRIVAELEPHPPQAPARERE